MFQFGAHLAERDSVGAAWRHLHASTLSPAPRGRNIPSGLSLPSRCRVAFNELKSAGPRQLASPYACQCPDIRALGIAKLARHCKRVATGWKFDGLGPVALIENNCVNTAKDSWIHSGRVWASWVKARIALS